MNHEKATSKTDMYNLIKRLLGQFSPRRRKQLIILIFLMIASAFAEVVSIGLVLPFLGVLVSPEKIMAYPIVAEWAAKYGITVAKDLIWPITFIFLIMVLTAGAVRLVQLWVTTRLTFAAGADLSLELYRRTLYQPYPVHLSRNSSVVVSGVIDKVNHVAFWVLMPLMTLFSSAFLLVSITTVLIFMSPYVALLSISFFGFSYGLVTVLLRHRLKQNSKLIAREQTQVIKALQEGLGGIRDVLLDGTQHVYCEIYRAADQPLRRAYGSNIFIAGSPRFAMEALGMAMISLLAYHLSTRDGGIAAAIPILGALALGAQRLLPALQQGYTAWASIAGCQETLSDVLKILEHAIEPESLATPPLPLQFNNQIQFKNVSFKYSEDETTNVLNNFNLTLKKGSRTGFVGTTGSGKSTTLDLLMGLLLPTQGEILVDGKPITGDRLRAWQRTIAHVPQSIYLSDSTIAENIAFGVPKEKIDLERVKLAAKKAQISDYIESRPHGYEAFVGERGIRISGGQRQRIGIARALYKQASVIVFDEATSALDNETEVGVMSAIEELSRDLTILIIAHRVSTLKHCDIIVELKDGTAKLTENAI